MTARRRPKLNPSQQLVLLVERLGQRHQYVTLHQIEAGAARIGGTMVSTDQCDAFGRLRGEHIVGRISDSVPNLLSRWRQEAPTSEGGTGRDHNPHAFTHFLAGGGVRAGFSYGVTDDYGYYTVDERMHVHDLHATILHLLGLDHERLTYRWAGRDFRLTDVEGRVARAILA